MVRVNRVIDRPGAENGDGLLAGEAGAGTVAAEDLARSVEFYRRVFSFHLEPDRQGSRVSAQLTGPNQNRLLIRAFDAVQPETPRPRLRFAVANLDEAREALWDSGVGVSRDSGQPDQIFRGPNGRSLYIRDPDGNEIELVEGCAEQRRADVGGDCRVAGWRRAMRRRCSEAC